MLDPAVPGAFVVREGGFNCVCEECAIEVLGTWPAGESGSRADWSTFQFYG